ncbi:ATP-binding protein [Streptomyces sp. S3(2020)]|uniref:GTP-binding protein n=1 Tax=Streptomyces sp. S3(2020) TaxID=2732044 RepID=UPI0014894AA2|nr:ATP/GTP-binding protein [Streptomyces sp. S3(2020)]NNN32196.1 ATP-binding protein [Streptomyces sp. S3(2020)]
MHAEHGAGRTVFKVVIAGGFGAGKTTAVGAISDIPPLSTEERLTEASLPVDRLDHVASKTTTTVAFDFGRVGFTDPHPFELLLFGTPGQQRFSHLWYDVCSGAVGAIVLVDTRRLEDSFLAVSFFEQIRLPFIIAINPFDGAVLFRHEDVRQALDIAPDIPVMRCDAREATQVAASLVALVDHALACLSTPAPLDI